MAGPHALLAEDSHIIVTQLYAVGKPAVILVPVNPPASRSKLRHSVVVPIKVTVPNLLNRAGGVGRQCKPMR